MQVIETEVWFECEVCGVAWGGPGLDMAVRLVNGVVICTECMGAAQRLVKQRSDGCRGSVETGHGKTGGRRGA